MSTRAIDQWAREAVALAVYECLLASATRFCADAQRMHTEAAWASPPHDQWVQWRARRKVRDDLKRAPDSAG